MTVFLDTQQLPQGPTATGGEASVADVFTSAVRSAWYYENANARQASIESAYNDRIDAVHRATGVMLNNPAIQVATEFGSTDDHGDAVPAFNARLAELQKQYPQHAGVIRADEPVGQEDALFKGREAEATAQDDYARYRGLWGTGALTSLAGGVVGALTNDPIQQAALLVGGGSAVPGIKGLIWGATKQGFVNAGAATVSQPFVAQWHSELGAGYTAADFAGNVGGAFAAGFLPEVAVRSGIRGVQALRGKVPILDKTGGIEGWESPAAAADRAARAGKSELLKKAAAGDTAALETLAKETGAIHDPVVKAALEMAHDIDATSTARPGVDPGLNADAELQVLRHLLDPREPAPKVPDPQPQRFYRAGADQPFTASLEIAFAAAEDPGSVSVVDVPHDRLGEVRPGGAPETFDLPSGLSAAERVHSPQEAEATRELASGNLSLLDAAEVMRAHPAAADASVSLGTDAMRQAHAISKLSDPVYEMVQRGEATPGNAALVSRLVPNEAQQASVLAWLESFKPRTEQEARHYIGEVTRDIARPDPAAEHGIDDPHGAEAAKQIEILSKALGVEPGRARDEVISKEPPAPRTAEDMAALHTTDRDARVAIIEDVKAGVFHDVEPDTLHRGWQLLADRPRAEGVETALLSHIEPVGAKGGPVGVRLTYRLENGTEFTLKNVYPVDVLAAPSGLLRREDTAPEIVGGHAVIGHHFLSLGGALEHGLKGRAVAEQWRYLVDRVILPREVDFLVGHAKKLQVLEMPVSRLEAALDGVEPREAPVARPPTQAEADKLAAFDRVNIRSGGTSRPIGQTEPSAFNYFYGLLRRADVPERELDQHLRSEAVAYMMQLADRGKLSADQLAPIAPLMRKYMPHGEAPEKAGLIGRSMPELMARLDARHVRSPSLHDVKGLIEAIDRHGVDGAREFLGGMENARRRDLEARLAGEMQRDMPAAGSRAHSELMTARALRDAGHALEGKEHADLSMRLHERAASFEASAKAGARPGTAPPGLGNMTVAHPNFRHVQLPLNGDGTVTFFRGEKRGQQMRNSTYRVFTSDLEHAKDFAGRDGVIHQVNVPQERLGEAVPRASSADNPNKVKPGQKVFQLSDDLARRARRDVAPDGIEAKALAADSSVDFQANLAHADALERMRDTVDWCKL